VGYRGKVQEQNRARDLRADGWTMPEIAAELGVSRSSVSLWVRDVPYVPRRPPRSGFVKRAPNALQRRKHEEIDRLLAEGRDRIGVLSERDLLIAGTALYVGEGIKRDGCVGMANTNPAVLLLFLTWLRHFFAVDETKLRVWLYLHEGLDVDAARTFWSEHLDIPLTQFGKAYRAVPDPTIRRTKHPLGCPRVAYASTSVHRAVMGLAAALLASETPFRGGAIGSAGDC
jgi:transcriptional regulator with XRE-family HTH domain